MKSALRHLGWVGTIAIAISNQQFIPVHAYPEPLNLKQKENIWSIPRNVERSPAIIEPMSDDRYSEASRLLEEHEQDFFELIDQR